jgi:pimeloyl-ACP methyl ester carboxylesterase
MSKHTLIATVRSLLLSFHKLKFKVSAVITPRRAAANGAALFSTPVRFRGSRLDAPEDIPVTRLREVPLASGAVTLYEWGNPATQPTVMLIHGWNGWALQFASFIPPLLAKGFAVVALDHRGHGRSAGRRSSLSGFIDTVQELHGLLPKVSGIVGHSLGAAAAACTLAQSRTTALQLVLIAPPNNPRVFLEKFAAMFGIPIRMTDAMQQWVEQRFGRTFAEVSVGRIAPNILARTLVIHDPADSVVPFEHGESYARLVKDAQLAPVDGFGHYRILRSPDAIRLAVNFVSEQES